MLPALEIALVHVSITTRTQAMPRLLLLRDLTDWAFPETLLRPIGRTSSGIFAWMRS